MVSWIFHFRWVLWTLGGALVLLTSIQFCLPLQFQKWAKPLRFEERFFYPSLTLLTGLFFTFAYWGKLSQLWSLSLHSQDFWLFVDLLEQMKKGGTFLTRFAPQSLGFVQHGSVHPMFSWAVLLPVAWVFGSVQAALLFNPLVLAGGGWMIGVHARRRWGGFYALGLASAFFATTQVGKILMYDVHPEAAYPFFTLMVLWALGLDGSGRVRWFSLIVSSFLCAGVKEDSFLILLPWVFWGLCHFFMNKQRQISQSQVEGLILCGAIAVGVAALQMVAVKNWSTGTWGPSVWEGRKVVRSAGVGLFQGVHWSGMSSVFDIIQKLMMSKGGITGAIWSFVTFVFSRPWLSLVIFAPWIFFERRTWIVLGPLMIAYSLLDSPRTLWNYYSAPFLGTFWYCVVDAKKVNKQSLLWTLVAALLFGSGSIDIYRSSDRVAEIRQEVQVLLPCLRGRGLGLVAPPLLSLVPLDYIWTDRLPQDQEAWEAISFVLYSPNLISFELPSLDIQVLGNRFKGPTKAEPCGGRNLRWVRYAGVSKVTGT